MSEINAAVSVEEISPVKAKLLFDVSWDDVKKEMDAVFREVGKKAKIKGFREGKVPRNILEVYYKDYVESETITNLINKHYWDALKTHDISAASQPEIEQKGIEKEKNFTFTATVERVPVIEPKDYTGLELEKLELPVTEKDIETKLEEFRQMFATMEEVKEDRGVREGDFATLDFSGTIDGVRMEELGAADFILEIGSKRFIPGFEEQLIGAAKGENREIRLSFPDDYYVKDIAGKEAIFTVTVKSIKEKKLPVLDSTFIENLEKYKSLDELKDNIRKSLEDQNSIMSQTEFRNLMVTELLKNNEFEVPPSYVDRELRYITADAQRRMAADGFSKQETEEMCGKFQDQYRQRAIRVVKVAALMDSIARKESIAVEESEVEAKIDEIAGQSRDNENTKKYFENEVIRENLKQEILHNKVFDFIEKQSSVKIVKRDSDASEEEK